ncbi:MAG: hypothetical protein ABIA37_05490 [Candidatus Woesearchaeota archaeon]
MKITKLFGIVLLLVILIPLASALSKPIAGRVNSAGLNVDLLVNVDSPLGKQTCIINPQIKTGPDGSFSTNLYNLVLKEFPTVDCSNYWKAGDKIWYEVTYQNDRPSSVEEEIKLGTGLQLLPELTLPITSSSSSSGSGGGGNIVLPTTITTESIIIQEDLFPLINIQKEDELLKIEVSLDSTQEVSLRLVIFSLPEEKIVYTSEDKITNTKDYNINLEQFKEGRYKMQAFIYSDDKLVDVSNSEQFLISREVIKVDSSTEISLQPVKDNPDLIIPFILYGISFVLILTTITLLVLSKK